MKELANIRNDVVGSLLRPPELKQARQNYDEGKLSLGELRLIEDREIRSAVRLQEELGLAVITDGLHTSLGARQLVDLSSVTVTPTRDD